MADNDHSADLIEEVPLPEVEYHFVATDGSPWRVLYCAVREGLSDLYEGVLVLVGELDQAPDDLLGSAARLEMKRGLLVRGLQGIVWRVEDLGSTLTHRFVRVTVVPRLRALGQRLDSRIFQDLTAAEIVRDVLARAGAYEGAEELVVPALARLPKREYCVQYRETDLDFVLRLLQEEGVPFYFKHDGASGEVMVLVDEPALWSSVPTMDGEAWVTVSDGAMNVLAMESVAWFDLQREVTGTSVTLRDYDFTRPRAKLDLTTAAPAGEAGPRPAYDYPSRVTMHSYSDERQAYTRHDGAVQARIRHELRQVGGVQGRGRGNVTGFLPGAVFELAGHMRQELNQAFLVTRVEHRGQAWSDIPDDVRNSEHLMRELVDAGVEDRGRHTAAQRYANRFEVIPATAPFRARRDVPRPLVHGSQTARVVGPENEEIHTDFHGRIKVQFHWDREGVEDERSSCWVRVAQNWAGAGWGFQFIPRIGMEVVVTFLEGDPDRPLVTGCVYNGENHVPYAQPSEKTRSGIKTNSSKTTGGYNEIRFEDRAGEEQVYVQAQRNMDTLVKNDQTLTVGRNRTKAIQGREKNTIGSDRTIWVQGNQSTRIGGNLDVGVDGGSGYTTHVAHTYRIVADDGIILQSGESSIVISPQSIVLQSRRIRIEGDDAVEIQGGVVKINCDGF